MEQKGNTSSEERPIGALMGKYALPCLISLLMAALYNIVDQLFIANAGYPGSYGNAANTVACPMTVVTLAIAVMIGDGCCALPVSDVLTFLLTAAVIARTYHGLAPDTLVKIG